MEYGTVPHFDRPIARMVLGSIPLSPDDRERSHALLDAYLEAGGNAIDTAHIYGPGRHKLIGEYLQGVGRDKLIFMDKGCHPMGRKRVTRDDMKSDILENHANAAVDFTEFFVLHRDDPEIPAGEVVDWLNENKDAGLIAGFGGSNWSKERLVEANAYAIAHGKQGFSFSSPNLALGVPNEPMWAGALTLTRDDRAWYAESGLPIFSWSSGSAGFFAGANSEDVRRVYQSDENVARRERLLELAKKLGATPSQMAVAWTLNQPLNVFAIIGPHSAAELKDNVEALSIKLSQNELDYLELGA